MNNKKKNKLVRKYGPWIKNPGRDPGLSVSFIIRTKKEEFEVSEM